MAPTLRSFSRPIIKAFTDAGIEDQLKDFDPPLYTEPWTPLQTRRNSRPANARPTEEGKQAAVPDYANRALRVNCAPRFGGIWVVMSSDVWEEKYAEERGERLDGR